MKKLISAVACCLVAMSVALAANDQQAKTGCQNLPPSEKQDSGEGQAASSEDPNEITGPLGTGEKRYVQQGDWMDYTIYFENKTNATAAAQEIFVDLPMDENLDWSTLELGEIAFGEHIDTSLSGKSHGKTSYPMPGTNTSVKTEVKMKDGVLSWYMRDWDLTTADNFPASATGGFLPPNDPETHCGEGHLSFRVRVKDDAPDGAVINASATIVFDSNAPIETDPSWFNTIGTFHDVEFEIDGVATNLTLIAGEPFGELPTPTATQAGYTFDAWYTGESGTGVKATPDAIVPTGNFTLYAHWVGVPYKVRFNANGGEGEMPDQQLVYDRAYCLSSNTYTYARHVFAGWATNETGEAVFEDGAEVQNLSSTANAVVDLYAVWGDAEPVTEFADCELEGDEGGTVSVSVFGGSEVKASSVKVYLTYGTATAADLDLGKTKYPITLKWAKGEVTNKTFTVKLKKDSVAEGRETFALQLANPIGMALGDAHVCTVTIRDRTSSLTLAEGLNNGLISPSCAKSSKWTAVESYKSDTNETKRTYVQSPAVAAGKTSTLTAGTFKGKGYLHFSLKFIGNDSGKKKASMKVYDGKNLLGTVTSTQNGDDWHTWYALCSGTGTHVIKFVFAQGSVKSVRIRLADVWWEPYDERPIWKTYATTSKLNGGYVGGQGIYVDGTKVTLKPRLRAGYEFDYWYDYYNDTILDSPATLSLTVTTNGYYVAYVKNTPTVRGLPETASGGTVAGGGVCARGKRVTLTAKPAKYNTFVGWYASKTNDANQIDEEAFLSKAVSLAVDRTSKPAAPTAKLFVVTGLTESVTYYAKFKPYPKVTVEVDNAKGGAVKGAGSYLAGKTVTLKATPKKGYAFCGWFDADGNLVSLNASYKYKVTADGLALQASFKKESALAKPELMWDATNLTVGVSYSAKLSVVGESLTSITKVTGLPKGLTYKSGKVSGVPTVAKAVTAKVTVALKSNAKKTWTYSVKLNVSALPIWAVGTFKGKGTFGGKDADVTLTVGKTGKISGKFVDAKKKAYSFTAASFAELDAQGVLRTAKGTLKYGTKTCKVEIAVAEGEAGGRAEVAVTGAVTASGALALP